MNIYESAEMYLEAIYVLSQRNNKVRSIDIANYLQYSKPSVSRAVHNLKNNEFIKVDMDGYISLLDKGEEVAFKIYKRHILLTEFLKALGVDAKTAEADACKMEHILSDETFNAICKHVANDAAKDNE